MNTTDLKVSTGLVKTLNSQHENKNTRSFCRDIKTIISDMHDRNNATNSQVITQKQLVTNTQLTHNINKQNIIDLSNVPCYRECVSGLFDKQQSALSNTILVICNEQSSPVVWAWVNLGFLAHMLPLVKSSIEFSETKFSACLEGDLCHPAFKIVVPAFAQFNDSDITESIFLIHQIRSTNGLDAVKDKSKLYTYEKAHNILFALMYLCYSKPKNECKVVTDIILKDIELQIIQKVYNECFKDDPFYVKNNGDGLIYIQLLTKKDTVKTSYSYSSVKETETETEYYHYADSTYKALENYADERAKYFNEMVSHYGKGCYVLERLLEFNIKTLAMFIDNDQLISLYNLKEEELTIGNEIKIYKKNPPFFKKKFHNLSSLGEKAIGVLEYDYFIDNTLLPKIIDVYDLSSKLSIQENHTNYTLLEITYCHPIKAGYILHKVLLAKGEDFYKYPYYKI